MLFDKITMLDYARPLKARAESRKVCGPYTWEPHQLERGAHPGRGFYQSPKGLAMDRHGSMFALRIEKANDHLGGRLAQTDGYYCDESGDETLQPIVARLAHGRGFLAGWTMGRSMCETLDGMIHDTIEDAAQAAHSLAEHDAEREHDDED